jgi:vitamin B12 transporter
MKLILAVFFIFLGFCCTLHAQQLHDTIILSPVEIAVEGPFRQKTGFFDSLTSIKVSLTSLVEQVRMYTPVFVREYSPGGISTVAFRGTSASHTIVLFDGFPVNPAMSGQADFSTMPPYLYDRAQISGSPESILLSPEALGGVVSMFTNPNEENKHEVRLRLETGSFGNAGGGIHLHKKAGKFLFRTRAYYHKSDNDFSFINNSLPEQPVEKRINAGFQKKGLMQEVFFVDNRQIAFVKFVGVSNFNELPAIILQPQIDDNESMYNAIVRLNAGYARTRGKHFISVKTLFSNEGWEYVNKSIDVAGINTIQTVAALFDWQYRFKEQHDVKLQWFSDYQQVKSPNYELLPNMQSNRLTASGNIPVYKFRLQPVLHLLKKDNRNPEIGGAMIVDRKLLKDKVSVSVSGGRSVRYPGFNDLYWHPGGNPLLLPETSLSGSVALEFNPIKWWTFHAGYVEHDVNNWIVWQPTVNSSVWTPENVRRVNSKSIDGMNIHRFDLFGFNIQSVLSYSYCSTVDLSDSRSPVYGKQLIYVPLHTGSHALQISIHKLNVTLQSVYTGKRYTRADNLSYMPSHFHHDIMLSYAWSFSNFSTECFVGAYNVTGENYQVIAWQPMPRRYFKFAIQFRLYEK